jgi:hypothetical protein
MNHHGFFLQGYFSDPIPVTAQFLFVIQKGMVQLDAGDRIDFLKRLLNLRAAVLLDELPQRIVFAHTSRPFGHSGSCEYPKHFHE